MATQFPSKEDETFGELVNFERQLHALIYGVSSEYARPGVHEIGYACKQGELLARDIAFICESITSQYEQAKFELEKEQEAQSNAIAM